MHIISCIVFLKIIGHLNNNAYGSEHQKNVFYNDFFLLFLAFVNWYKSCFVRKLTEFFFSKQIKFNFSSASNGCIAPGSILRNKHTPRKI